MENKDNQIKRLRGRPIIYTKEEIKNHRTVYMMNKPWYCDICKNNRNYKMAGKHCHMKSKKHIRNAQN